jgi:radical SAM protein with 4Fe4S-binding SPASM domain
LSHQRIKVDTSKWGNNNLQKPVHVSIELTYACNYRCKHCYNESGSEHEKFFDFNVLKKVLDGLYENGVYIIELTGGEPLLHPDFRDIVEYALKKFELVAIITNGYLISEELLDSLVTYKDKLIFQVDLHGTRVYMDWFCDKKGAFDKIKKNIELITERDYFLRVIMIVTKLNYNQIIETVTLAKQLSSYPKKTARAINYTIGLSGFVPQGRVTKSPEILFDHESMISANNELYKAKKEFGNFIFELPDNILKELNNQCNCGAGTRTLVITPTGDIKLCPMADDSVIFGNVYKNKITEIFSKKCCNEFVDLQKPNPETCGNCKYLFFCNDCLARGFIKYQEIGKKCLWGLKIGLSKKIFNKYKC